MFYVNNNNTIDALWLPTIPGRPIRDYTRDDLTWLRTTPDRDITSGSVAKHSDIASFPVRMPNQTSITCIVVFQNDDDDHTYHYYNEVSINNSTSPPTFNYKGDWVFPDGNEETMPLDGSTIYIPPPTKYKGSMNLTTLSQELDVEGPQRMYYQGKNNSVIEAIWHVNHNPREFYCKCYRQPLSLHILR